MSKKYKKVNGVVNLSKFDNYDKEEVKMFNLNNYINNVKEDLKVERKNKVSKVKKEVVEIVKNLLDNNEVSSYKRIREKLGKSNVRYENYLRKLVKESSELDEYSVKVEGRKRVLVILSEYK